MEEDLFERRKPPTVTKHELLESYLRPWARIVGSHFPRAWYVDAFAGGATYKSGEKGSAPMAAEILIDEQRRLAEKKAKKCSFSVMCIESDADRARELSAFATEISSEIPFVVLHGEFVAELGRVLVSVGRDPAFIFLDPTGFSGMPMTAVRRILGLGHKEALINFMWNAIRRWSGAASTQRAVTELMGTNAWTGLHEEREWLDLYMRQLRDAGCYVWAFRNKFPDKNRTFYYLVYATTNLTGFKIMKEIMLRRGTTRSFEPDLFEQIEFSEFVKRLGARISSSGAQTWDELLVFTLCDTQYVEKDLRRALKQLELAGRVSRKEAARGPVYRPGGEPANPGGSGLVRESQVVDYGLREAARVAGPLQHLKVAYQTYRLLHGEDRILVRQVADGSIIRRFDKTPLPRTKADVVCPHFLELKWAYGCPYDCAWCYLKGTLRFLPHGAKPSVKDFDKVRRHTAAFLMSDSPPELLNTGEIADSLMLETERRSFVSFILPLFEAQNRHKILFLTKSDRIRSLLAAPSHQGAIVSYSLNAHQAADRWELKAPDVSRRIKAAARLSAEGYEVRLRIDPIVPVSGWREAYCSLLDEIFELFTPARVTLGSLRGLQSTINNCPDRTWVHYLSEPSGWGRRIEHNLRCEIFATLIEALRERYHYSEVGLCKETLAVWNGLGMDFRHIRCNCIL